MHAYLDRWEQNSDESQREQSARGEHFRTQERMCIHTHTHTKAQIIHGDKFAQAAQKREEMEKRRKEARRPRVLEGKLWNLIFASVMQPRLDVMIENEKAQICQELASLGWTMDAKLAGFCGPHWQGPVEHDVALNKEELLKAELKRIQEELLQMSQRTRSGSDEQNFTVLDVRPMR